MAQSNREKFLRVIDRITETDEETGEYVNVEEVDVREALLGFADALDPKDGNDHVPAFENRRRSGDMDPSHGTARAYLTTVLAAHDRGLDVLDADARTVNRFMADLRHPPADRKRDLVDEDYTDSISKSTAKRWVAGFRAFYRWANDPQALEPRPEVVVEWADVDGTGRINMPSVKAGRTHVQEESWPAEAELEAMREGCIQGQNTLRDHAFLEVAAGTGQRVYCLVTLKVGDVRGHIDGDCRCDHDFAHVLLNQEIAGDGDKDAIAKAGRMRPVLTDVGPVKRLIEHHQLRDPEVRARVGAPEDFDDAFLFVGDLGHRHTDAASHWHDDGPRDMLERRRDDTADMPGVETVDPDVPVNPHAWRALAYTRSLALPKITQTHRRAMFGWSPGSDVGDTHYQKKEANDLMGEVAAAAAEAGWGEAGVATVAEQVAGPTADLTPEARRQLVHELVGDDEARSELQNALGIHELTDALEAIAGSVDAAESDAATTVDVLEADIDVFD